MTNRDPLLADRVSRTLRPVPDFPTPGVRFLDIGPVIADAELLALVTEAMAAPFMDAGITHVLGVETRGLYFAGAIAMALGAGLVPVRKPGKLPLQPLKAKGTIQNTEQVGGLARIDPSRESTYRKPYEFEMAEGVLAPGDKVLVVDDLLAKGGSVHACRALVEQTGAALIGAAFVVELGGLGGRANLEGLTVHAVVSL